MEVIKFGEQLNSPIVVCLGFFGCMHKGHVELLERAKNRAKMTHSKVALFTFSNNHLAVLNREATVVYTYEERLSIYDSLGVDYVIAAEFDDGFRKLTGKEFLSEFKRYDVQGIFCGFDYSCGRDRLDAASVRNFFKNASDPPVYIVEQICIGGEKAGTTLLRKYLRDSDVAKANALLSEPFFVLGVVGHGRGVGKTLGFPTANVTVPGEKLLPQGVFSARVYVDGVRYPAIVNIGDIPTFGISSQTFEVHLINFNGDLYGKTLKVSLIKYLRPVTKFDSADALSAQLQRDKEAALND